MPQYALTQVTASPVGKQQETLNFVRREFYNRPNADHLIFYNTDGRQVIVHRKDWL